MTISHGSQRSDRRASKAVGWVFTTVLATVIGMILGATALQSVINQAVSHVDWAIHHGNAKPNCADTGYYSLIKVVNSNAFDYYRDPDGAAYPDNLTSDNDRRTGWVEAGFGKIAPKHDVISWDFDGTSQVKLICVRNGLTDTPFSFNDTGQMRLLHIDCGPSVIPHTFPDLRSTGASWENYQSIRLNCDAKAVVFVIKTIYPARDGSNTDQVAISDVEFYG